jgi:hypothetical protein
MANNKMNSEVDARLQPFGAFPSMRIVFFGAGAVKDTCSRWVRVPSFESLRSNTQDDGREIAGYCPFLWKDHFCFNCRSLFLAVSFII